jgi:hypothetical protein
MFVHLSIDVFFQIAAMAEEPKRVQIIRSHQRLDEFTIQKDPSVKQSINQDYYVTGWKRLNAIQLVPLRESWPMIIGTALSASGSGLIGR